MRIRTFVTAFVLALSAFFLFKTLTVFYLYPDFRSYGISARNFDQVKPGIWRGGKPTPVDIEKLKRLEVKTIIDFTMANRTGERKKTKELGIKYINIPWDTDTWLTWFYDYNRVTKKFLSIVEDPANLPVYVHCLNGRDRTGTMVAVYRIKNEGWSSEKAVAEMKHYGFDEKKYPNLVRFLRKFEKEMKNLQ